MIACVHQIFQSNCRNIVKCSHRPREKTYWHNEVKVIRSCLSFKLQYHAFVMSVSSNISLD